MTIEIGQTAPAFTLKNSEGTEVSLSDFAPQPVVLVFIPFAFTGNCQAELCQLRDDLGVYESAGAQVVAVSCDSKNSLKVWGEQQGYTFPLLSDFWPHGATAQAYGVFNDALGCANRATFLIGPAGTVVDSFASDSLGTVREADRYREALAKL